MIQRKIVGASRLDGTVTAPPSKSVTQRAVACALLAEGVSTIVDPSLSDDGQAAVDLAGMLGARIVCSETDGQTTLAVHPRAADPAEVLFCGESGLSLRMFAPIAALWDKQFILEGRDTLIRRPMGMLEAPLQALGARCETMGGLQPVTVQGPLQGGEATVDGSVSSQPVSGLLLALPRCPKDSVLSVADLRSKPYVRMTLRVAAEFGVSIEADEELSRFVVPGNQAYRACEYRVEGDWSGAAFLLVAGAIAGKVSVRGLRADSAQADRRILEALDAAGAKISWDGDVVTVEKNDLHAFTFDAVDSPDLFPPLVALAAYCEGTSSISGVGRLRHKESDRAAALVQELALLGVPVGLEGQAMRITGAPVYGHVAESRGDHRIAMALAVLGLGATQAIYIDDWQCVTKSYPDFFADLAALGADVSDKE